MNIQKYSRACSYLPSGSIVEDLGYNLGILADRRVGGNTDFEGDAEGGVPTVVVGDVLIKRQRVLCTRRWQRLACD